MALVSVCTAYLCCQLPRWVELTAASLTGSEWVGEVCYTLVIGPIFYLLYRFFVRPAHAAMTASPHSLLLFGSLPAAYYVFDYATVVYSDALYRGYGAVNEFLPTALIIFYVIFLTAYHTLNSRRVQAEMQNAMLEAGLKQSRIEVDALRRAEVQTAVYQHDMRHHLNAIDSFLAAGRPQQAEADRWVTLYCGVRLGKLLVEVRNPCAEGLVLRGGLPVSGRAGHGYGCRSIQAIAKRRGGLCEFRAQGGIFTLRFMLPLAPAAGADG